MLDRKQAKRIATAKMQMKVMRMMRSEDAESNVKAMNRMQMLVNLTTHIDRRANDEIRIKRLKKKEEHIKSACIGLVKKGLLVSKRGMYALPDNVAYL